MLLLVFLLLLLVFCRFPLMTFQLSLWCGYTSIVLRRSFRLIIFITVSCRWSRWRSVAFSSYITFEACDSIENSPRHVWPHHEYTTVPAAIFFSRQAVARRSGGRSHICMWPNNSCSPTLTFHSVRYPSVSHRRRRMASFGGQRLHFEAPPGPGANGAIYQTLARTLSTFFRCPLSIFLSTSI